MKFKILSCEEGRGKPHTERFPTLESAALYIKERWEGVDYIDGPASFHTDYSTYELVGFLLKDIGKTLYGTGDEAGYRIGFEFKIDAPGRHRILVVKGLDGEVHHYRASPSTIEEQTRDAEDPRAAFKILGNYDDVEYLVRFGKAYVDEWDGILTPEEQDQLREHNDEQRHADGHVSNRKMEALARRLHAALFKPEPQGPPDPCRF
jgi:hypothetical protein